MNRGGDQEATGVWAALEQVRRRLKAAAWRRAGRPAETAGYNTARWLAIENDIAGGSDTYGFDAAGLDERVVEYPWVFDRMQALHRPGDRVLDAGSVLNHQRILVPWRRAGLGPVSIVTLKYEGAAHPSDAVRYEFADLRELPYRDGWFAQVLCISTMEHVGLDNTIYGAAAERADPSVEASKAMTELARVTAPGGTLLLSVPFGAQSNRGWFRVFDSGDLDVLASAPGWRGATARYFRATGEGWRECAADAAASAGYNEWTSRAQTAAHVRNAPTWVAAAEAVALLELTRA